MSQQSDIIIIFGCGGHSRSVVDVLLSNKPDARVVFVDANAREGEKIFGFDVCREYPLENEQVFLAIGDNQMRKIMLGEIGEKNLISIISPTAHLGQSSIISKGCFVGNFCHVGPEAFIGKNTILNTSAVIEHGVSIGEHCHICPRVVIAGRSRLADLVFIGTGTTIGNMVTICSDVIVGAGSTVISDIKGPGTYVGCPVRRIT